MLDTYCPLEQDISSAFTHLLHDPNDLAYINEQGLCAQECWKGGGEKKPVRLGESRTRPLFEFLLRAEMIDKVNGLYEPQPVMVNS